MKKCSEIKDCISLYIDNELDPDELKAFEEHMAACADCRSELDEMMQIVGLCKDIPEVELPENFKAELHIKLLEVHGQTQKAGKPPFFYSGYFKLFSSVAAVFLLVFLIRGLYGFDLFQGTKTSNSADRPEMAAEAPAQAQAQTQEQTQAQDQTQAEAQARKDMSFADETTADRVMSQPAAKYRSSTGAGASDSMQETVPATREPDRFTSGDRNVQLMAEAKLAPEKVTRNQTTLVVTVDDPAAQLESIRNIVLENGGAEQQKAKADVTVQAAGETQEADTQETATQETGTELVMSVPNIQYETFLKALKTNYGETNVTPGEIITEDMGPAIEELLKRSDSLDSEMEKLEKDTSGQGQEELDRLNAEKLEIQDEIDALRLGTDNIAVKIILKKA